MMKVERIALSMLHHPERNVRMHTDKQLKEFIRSLNMFGQIRPIVVDEGNVILAGNGLYEAMKQMGAQEADCYVVAGLSEKQKHKLMLADNRIFSLGVDDLSAFDAIIADLGDDCDIPGYDSDLIKTLISSGSEIDEILSGYGSFGSESRAAMQTNAERAEQSQPVDGTADSNGEPPTEALRPLRETDSIAPYSAPERTEDTADTISERYVICPKCGERIYLRGDVVCR